ncbi:ABC transporter ATP-binding protein [Candidatus Trichorickettsia mobilis]|uniref:ABC transporter ATP-binding protein n=1 Tax=Candidatus Trichorickettsia mobilis TaxID=1346319 RepID=A0ABZ0UT24_9RICK|nr:ATP-binding cassette domain-containing protein [Candidatus Trichorickettsia mobilis]WPY01185.1 ABC transporter ATP-binding protein [Candidatus Trichorickettsia mobilis]
MSAQVYAEKITIVASDREVPILFETSIAILPEEFVIILGHNGSGKSSLIKVLSGERIPTSGRVFIGEQLLSNMTLLQKAQELITVSQVAADRLFIELTLAENIDLWESRFSAVKRLNYAQIIALTSNPERFEQYLHQQVRTLSGGEKQALLLALVLAHPPRVLFLDEPTSALDPRAAQDAMQFTSKAIAVNKITTLMVTHHLEDAVHYGNRLIILDEGRIVFDQKKTANLSMEELKEIMSSIRSRGNDNA